VEFKRANNAINDRLEDYIEFSMTGNNSIYGLRQFYDCAAACRELHRARSNVMCRQPDRYSYRRGRDCMHETDSTDMDDSVCFHRRSYDCLEMLQKHAIREIQERVFVACQTLPTELADEIFECALAAEGVSRDWRVHTWEGVRRGWYRLIKDQYRCVGLGDHV